MHLRGEFSFWLPRPASLMASPHHWMGEPDLVVANMVTEEGMDEFLQAIAQDVFTVAGAADFYFGLCNQTPARADDLTSINSEPSSAGGYARQAIERSSTGWPTMVSVNGHQGIRTQLLTFTATGADFSAAVSRAFMTDAASGDTGVLYAYSGALTVPVVVTDGNALAFHYTLWGR